jgi:DNA polymerase-3 subunit alpha
MTLPRFLHLRLHTEYSLLEGAVRVASLPDLCRDAGMPAVAVTDTNNMFCALEFSERAADAGIQPIMGCQLDMAWAVAEPGAPARLPAPMVLLAKNDAGYANLGLRPRPAAGGDQ